MSNYAEGTTVAGRFVILGPIGEGGMGTVYRALQRSLDREVALKVLHSKVAFTARARRRFGREARAIARLNHPHIAGVFDFGADDDGQSLWLAMEFIAGHAMTRLKRQDVDVLRLASLTDQVLSALSAAHARGIIHRDLKPSNILLAQDDEGREVIKLVDFGLAAAQAGDLHLKDAPGGLADEVSEAQPKKRIILGTPRYMAPEIFRRQPVDPRVDLYALGVILFEILAGTPPYPGDDPREVMKGHLREPIPRLEPRDGGEIPADFERIIYRLLAKDPDERFQTAAEVREHVQAIINQFSYVPWMVTGPRFDDPASGSHPGNLSAAGFLSGYGNRTIPPSAMLGGVSKFGAAAHQTAPLVGRLTERRRLERQLSQAVSHARGSLVFLNGEAGIGKSRLIDWVRVRVEEAGLMQVVTGEFHRSHGGFSGVRSALEAVLGTRDVSNDEVPHVVASRLGRWGFGEHDVELVSRLMLPGDDDALFKPDGSMQTARRERVFATVEQILRRAAEQRPLLIVLEDLHHAGEPTAAFLEHLALGIQLNPVALVLVAAHRSEAVSPASPIGAALERLRKLGADEITFIELGRMPDDEVQTLVEKLAPIGADVAAQIARRASGNPLHATELLRYLQESGKLAYDNGQWRLEDARALTDEVPTEIAELMRYRVRQVCDSSPLGDATRAILERCAILGTRFDYRIARWLVRHEPSQPWADDLDPVLELLVTEGILREVGHSGEDILEFDHVLLREVLLADMDGRRSLRKLHGLAADAKIAFYGDRIDHRALEIVDHYRRARQPRGVYLYTLKAARAAANASDLKTAMQLYREAEELVDSARLEEASAEELAEQSYVLHGEEVALEVAHLERRVGEYASARSHYRQLLAMNDPDVALWARWGLGKLAEKQGDLDEAEGWFEAARREAESARVHGNEQLAERIEARCLCALGGLALMRSDYTRAEMLLGEAVDAARQLAEAVVEAEALGRLSEVYLLQGKIGRADKFHRRGLILAESVDDDEALAHHRLRAAWMDAQAGGLDRARESLEAACAAFEELGAHHALSECLLRRGEISLRAGDLKDAARDLRAAHKGFSDYDDRRGVTQCKLALAKLALEIGRKKEAATLGKSALKNFEQMGDQRGVGDAEIIVGRLALAKDEPVLAAEWFARAVATFEAVGHPQGAVAARLWRALALDLSEQSEEADRLVEAVIVDPHSAIVSEPAIAAACDTLTARVNSRRPELAMDLDQLAEAVLRRLGRRVA